VTPKTPTSKINTDLRRKAELRLIKRVGPLPEGNENIQRWAHEIYVYQIELEMQNAALLEMQAELESANRKYTDLFENAPVGYATLTPAGIIQEINGTAASLLGATREKLKNTHFVTHIRPDDSDTWNRLLSNIQRSDTDMKESTELTLLRKDGGVFPALIMIQSYKGVGDKENPHLRLSFINRSVEGFTRQEASE